MLTGGYRPRQAVLDAIRRADLFATLVVGADTYAVASDVHDLLVKTHPSDHGKITEIKDLVWEHLEIDRVLEVATTPGSSRVEGPPAKCRRPMWCPEGVRSWLRSKLDGPFDRLQGARVKVWVPQIGDALEERRTAGLVRVGVLQRG